MIKLQKRLFPSLVKYRNYYSAFYFSYEKDDGAELIKYEKKKSESRIDEKLKLDPKEAFFLDKDYFSKHNISLTMLAFSAIFGISGIFP